MLARSGLRAHLPGSLGNVRVGRGRMVVMVPKGHRSLVIKTILISNIDNSETVDIEVPACSTRDVQHKPKRT